MRKEDCEARTLIALAVGVGFGLIIGAAVLAAAYPVFQSEKWAAWIQAIGSIAAIGGAYWAGRGQVKLLNDLEKDKRRNAVLAIADVAIERARLVSELLSLSVDTLSDDELITAEARLYCDYHKLLSDGVVAAIASIPIHDVGSSKAIIALQGLQVQFGFLDKAISNLHDGPDKVEFCNLALKNYERGTESYWRLRKKLKNTLRSHVRDRIKYIEKHYAELIESI